MNNIISISTGCVYRTFPNKTEALKELLKLAPEGIELSFPFPEMIQEFEFTKEVLNKIRELKHFSIHASWKEVDFSSRDVIDKMLFKLEKLAQQSLAKNIVFHTDILSDDFLQEVAKYNFKSSFENMDFRKESGQTLNDIKSILDQNEQFGFVLDIAHAIDLGEEATNELLQLRNRITEVHFSILNRGTGRHELVSNENTPQIFEYLSDINAPLVLEGAVRNDIQKEILKEVDLIRSI